MLCEMNLLEKINRGLSSITYKNYSTVFLLLFFHIMGFLGAQNAQMIEKINRDLEEATQKAYSSRPEKVIPVLEAIQAESEKIGYPQGVIKVGYSLAIIYFNSSDYEKVISLDTKYEEIGKSIKDYGNLSHIYRLKACAYSELGLLSQSQEEFKVALLYAHKIKAGDSRQYALSLIYSNLANFHLKSESPSDSIMNNIQKCIKEAEKIQDGTSNSASRKYSLISYSYIILGNEYAKKGSIELSENYYLKALNIHHTKEVPLVEHVVLLNQLAYFYYDKGDFNKSIQFAEEGLKFEKKSSVPQLRKDLFQVLSKAYLEVNKTEESKEYFQLFTSLNDSIASINKKAVDAALNQTISKQKELKNNNQSKQYIIYSLLGLVALVFGISFYFYRKKQIQIKRIKNALEQFKEKQRKEEEKQKNNSPKVAITDEKEDRQSIMPAEAEEKLLEKLQEFENRQLYLERKVSLSFVAAEIETNTKYLSYIIKKHKEKDFSEYINDLRIQYIVDKITHDPVYRQYKINALAEETGFSSHSKFTTVFKATIGVSPSEFIKYSHKNT